MRSGIFPAAGHTALGQMDGKTSRPLCQSHAGEEMKEIPAMIKNVDEYLQKLRNELRGSDPALVQDALADAEEHLRMGLDQVRHEKGAAPESEVLKTLIDKYGDPVEVASAYREIEAHSAPALPPPRRQRSSSLWGRFFGIYADARAWGSFLYLLFGLVTGCFYGMWTLFGTSLSLFSLILIIGLPVSGLFLLSVRGIALMEGRIVEAMLGVRMPRRSLFVQEGLSWKGRFKALVTESQTWRSLVYLFLQFPLGALYSIVTFVLFGFSIKMAIYPFWYHVLERPLITIVEPYFPPGWLVPFVCLAGFLLLPLTLHLTKRLGRWHGRYAKAMLVSKMHEGRR
jgi:hypothetical protein